MKAPKARAFRGVWGMLPQKISKSRRSEMPFLVFSWWYFPPNIIKIQTKFNSVPGANKVELF